jgi:membrane protein
LQWIYQFADTTLKQASGGIVAGVGIIALLWTVTWLAASVETSFNAVWDLPPRRNILRKVSSYIAVVLVTPVILVVMSSAGVLIRNILNKIAGKLPNPAGSVTMTIDLVIMLLPVIVSIILFTIIYFAAPNTKVRFRSALLAGVITGIVFQLFQDGFIYLQRTIFNYNRIYGSFAALPLFLTWLKLSWQLALFGAEISFVEQNIDSGRFDVDPEGKFSMARRNIFRIALAGTIYKNFSNNSGATSESELVSKFGITRVEADVELECLRLAGVIYRTDESTIESAYFIPALDASTLTVAECLEHIDNKGLANSNLKMANVSSVIAALNAARSSSLANVRLCDLGN